MRGLAGRKAMVWAWSVLAAIFAHALLPHGDPVERVRGSAFSASTEDVLVLRVAPALDLSKRKYDSPAPADPPTAIPSARAALVSDPIASEGSASFAPSGNSPRRLAHLALPPPARAPPILS